MPKYTPESIVTMRELVLSLHGPEIANSLTALQLKAIGEKLRLQVYEPKGCELEEDTILQLEVQGDSDWLNDLPTDDEPYVEYTVYEHGSLVNPVDRHW